MTEASNNTFADREIITSRVFDAPRELVWRVWTQPEHAAKWWGPNGFTNTIHAMDVRPGGIFRFTMHGPDGVNYPNEIKYLEVVEPERLIYLHGDGEDGEDVAMRPFHVIVTFVDHEGKSEVTMRARFETAAQRDLVAREFGAIEGAQQHFDCLGQYLATLA